jgi:predicted ester cyclase
MTTREAENKSIVRRFYAAFEADDVTTLNELLAPDLVAYSHAAPGPQNREVHLQGIRGWNATFSGTQFVIEDQIAGGDKVATRVTLRATHNLGDFQGLAPTGKQVAVPAVSIEHIKDGKIAERRVTSDWLGMMQQLGLVPPPQPSR